MARPVRRCSLIRRVFLGGSSLSGGAMRAWICCMRNIQCHEKSMSSFLQEIFLQNPKFWTFCSTFDLQTDTDLWLVVLSALENVTHTHTDLSKWVRFDEITYVHKSTRRVQIILHCRHFIHMKPCSIMQILAQKNMDGQSSQTTIVSARRQTWSSQKLLACVCRVCARYLVLVHATRQYTEILSVLKCCSWHFTWINFQI